ncbi:GNAT family N-acetyltransferase [Paraliobacillus ryukyuensis]|uniref:GNAT family N-acetyltransferase n=1 Tax=Paraliobacillus ryukyuensis TaxID=200904 RepID=UPI0009A60EA5|nr:GNAT family N-acetyltransferase [Paraliobacillus ryukyuensis]
MKRRKSKHSNRMLPIVHTQNTTLEGMKALQEIIIRDYQTEEELDWLDVHASVMVDSYAWWTVLHQKPTYTNDTIDLVAVDDTERIVGFITIEMNAAVVKEQSDAGFAWEFGVHRNYRRNGIGKQLISAVHQRMRSQFMINRSIWYSQDKQAQQFYEKMGMVEIARHWQFSVVPNEQHKSLFKQNKFDCWEMRGSCAVEDFEEVKQTFKLIEDDDTLNPQICIGYEWID